MGRGGGVGLAATAGLVAGSAAGVVGVESNATVLVVGWLVPSSSLAAGASVYLGEGAAVAALPGAGLELFEESVAEGSEGIADRSEERRVGKEC